MCAALWVAGSNTENVRAVLSGKQGEGGQRANPKCPVEPDKGKGHCLSLVLLTLLRKNPGTRAGGKGRSFCLHAGPLSTICLQGCFGCQNSCLIGQPNTSAAELQEAQLNLCVWPQTSFLLLL